MNLFTRYKKPITKDEAKQLITIFVETCRQRKITEIQVLIKDLNPNAVKIINNILKNGRIKKIETFVDRIYNDIVNSKSLNDQEKEKVFQSMKALYIKSQKLQSTSQHLEEHEKKDNIRKRVITGVMIFSIQALVFTACSITNITKYMEPFSTNSYKNDDDKGPMDEFIDYGLEKTGLDKPTKLLMKVDTNLDEIGAEVDKLFGNNREDEFQEGQLEQIGFPVSTQYLNRTLQDVINLNANSENSLISPNTLCVSNEDVTFIRNISAEDNKIYAKTMSQDEYKIIPYIRNAIVIGTESTKTNLNTGEITPLNEKEVTIIGVPNEEGKVLISYTDSYEGGDNVAYYTAFYLTDYSNLSESTQNIEDIEDKYFHADIASFKDVAMLTDQNENKIIKQPGENIYIIDLPKVTSEGVQVKVLYVSPIENTGTLMIIKTDIIDSACLNNVNIDNIEQPEENLKPSNEEYITIGNILLYPTKDCRENTEIVKISEKVANINIYPKSGKDTIYVELTINESNQIIKGWIRKADMKNLIVDSRNMER